MKSSSVEYVVKYILPHYSDRQLANMLEQRPGEESILHRHTSQEIGRKFGIARQKFKKESILRRAILQEMGNRCAAEYAARYMGSAV
jgi:hypothetical protein